MVCASFIKTQIMTKENQLTSIHSIIKCLNFSNKVVFLSTCRILCYHHFFLANIDYWNKDSHINAVVLLCFFPLPREINVNQLTSLLYC